MQVQPKTPSTVPTAPRPSRPEQRVDSVLLPPGKFEVTPELTFSFDIAIKEFKGRWVIIEKDTKGAIVHSVTFRIWSYDEMIDLRRKSTTYDSARRINSLDNDLLNRLKIQKLLVSWTFGNDNPRLNIQHVNGVLTDESWKAFTKLSPNIAERIINEMNLVLDYGG